MDPIVSLLLGLVLGVVLGAIIGWLVTRSRTVTNRAATMDADPALLEARHAVIVAELRSQESVARAEVGSQLAAAAASLAGLREQLAAAQEQYRDLIERERSDARKRAEAERDESKVLQALAPVKETLSNMQQKVTELETQRSQQHGELSQQLKSATESEERLRATAESLASALRNNATRGVWGETQLRTLVESAGLVNRVDFTVQSTIESESGTRRPDMVINLPGGKSIPVDAKVPYNAYIEAAAIPSTATGEQESRRNQLLNQHAKQVKAHVDALASKSYWTGLPASPDFTIAFIPNEPLLAAAMESDPTLMEYAFSKHIILSNPVTLWALLKTIAFTWQQDVLTDDAKKLFDLGKELYSRLATLSDHADKLRRSIESTVNSYNVFASSLEQRVLVTARKLDALDESKVIGTPAHVDERPKQLSQPELVQSELMQAELMQAELRQAELVEAELRALDETGVARPELDFDLADPSVTALTKPKTA